MKLYKNVSIGIISLLLLISTAKTQTYVSLTPSPFKTASYILPANSIAQVVYFSPQYGQGCGLSITGGIFKDYNLELPSIVPYPYSYRENPWPIIVGPSTIVCRSNGNYPALCTLEVRSVTATKIIAK
jgi:hypothetical protein